MFGGSVLVRRVALEAIVSDFEVVMKSVRPRPASI
jgi:hypothetical protein